MAAAQRTTIGEQRVVRTLTVRATKIEVLDDGILYCTPTSNDIDLPSAIEMISTFRELTPPGQKYRLLLDERNVTRKSHPEARKYMQSNSDAIEKMAILVGNTISRFFATGLLVVAGLGERTKVFDSESAALHWLRESR